MAAGRRRDGRCLRRACAQSGRPPNFQWLLGKRDRAETAHTARAHGPARLVEDDLVAALDAVGKLRFDFGEGQRRGEPDAALRSGAGDLGNGEKRLARQRRCRIDIGAAAIGQEETRHPRRDSSRCGRDRREPEESRRIATIFAARDSPLPPATALSAPLPLAATGRGCAGGACLEMRVPSRYSPIVCAIAIASRARPERSRRNASMRCPRSTSLPPSPRSVRTTAISAASSASPALAPSTTMRASRGGSGRLRSRRPSSVMRPSRSIAPSSPSNAFASASAGAGGGSRKASVAGSATPQWARSSTKPDKSAARISGRLAGSSEAVCGFVPQPIADAGLGASGAAPPLVGRGARHAHGLEPGQPHVGLVARHPRQAGVDHHAHPFDRQRRLGDRGREHDLSAARRCRRDRPILDLGFERAVERHDVDGRIVDALAQERLGAADLGCAREKYQQRSGYRCAGRA